MKPLPAVDKNSVLGQHVINVSYSNLQIVTRLEKAAFSGSESKV